MTTADLDPALLSVRQAYDQVAPDYAETLRNYQGTRYTENAIFRLFADLVRASGEPGPVGDIGCGPGRITAHLAALGLDVFGVDLAPAMIEVARRDHPGLRFEIGTMTALDIASDALAGALGWYSLIHLPGHLVPVALAEFHRVIRPGGPLLLGFQEGEGPRPVVTAYGHDLGGLGVQVHRRALAEVGELLGTAGFTVFSSTLAAPRPGELDSQAYVLAHKD